MKKFNQWLNIISVMILIIAVGYFNLAWLKHRDFLNQSTRIGIIFSSILFIVFVSSIMTMKSKRRK